MLKSKKVKNFLVFTIIDGDISKEVKYDLATGKTYGYSGKEVKSISNQLKGYTIQSLIETFEDEKYKKYLKFLNDEIVNRLVSKDRNYRTVGSKVTNIGTFLSQINEYRYLEQYFSAGIENIDYNFHHNISELPKGYIIWSKDSGNKITEKSYQRYLFFSNEYGEIERIKNNFEELTLQVLEDLFVPYIDKKNKHLYYNCNPKEFIIIEDERWNANKAHTNFKKLINEYHYNKSRLLSYLDNLVAFEGLGTLNNYGLNLKNLLEEIVDYNKMLSEISLRKYEKYPKNFLTVHAITCRNYNRLNKEYPVKDFSERVCLDYETEIDKYTFIYPKTPQDIKDEAIMQSNCVASYINNVLEGKCHIMFMRYKDKSDESLVTLEIRKDKVVQQKGKFNRDTTEEENECIKKFEKHLQKIFVSKIQENKNKVKLIDLNTQQLKRRAV